MLKLLGISFDTISHRSVSRHICVNIEQHRGDRVEIWQTLLCWIFEQNYGIDGSALGWVLSQGINHWVASTSSPFKWNGEFRLEAVGLIVSILLRGMDCKSDECQGWTSYSVAMLLTLALNSMLKHMHSDSGPPLISEHTILVIGDFLEAQNQ